MSRKLQRTVSTCCEDMDILDEALSELSKLNSQRRIFIRQSWARRNPSLGPTSKLRSSMCSSLSSSSNSSASQSCSSTSSSFSSSRSATLSTSSESWDSFSDDMSTGDCRLSRRSSKPKLNHFRPYCKPRRFSLQLVSHPESPELDDLMRSRNADLNLSSHLKLQHPLVAGCERTGLERLTPPKYSRMSSEKENVIKVKSNPTSPSKPDISINAICVDANYLACATQEKLLSVGSSLSSPMGLLVRSKSLDDLTCIGLNEPVNSNLFPKSLAQPQASSSCDIENVLQRISTLQV